MTGGAENRLRRFRSTAGALVGALVTLAAYGLPRFAADPDLLLRRAGLPDVYVHETRVPLPVLSHDTYGTGGRHLRAAGSPGIQLTPSQQAYVQAHLDALLAEWRNEMEGD